MFCCLSHLILIVFPLIVLTLYCHVGVLCAILVHTFIRDLTILFSIERADVLKELGDTSDDFLAIFISGGREDVIPELIILFDGLMSC